MTTVTMPGGTVHKLPADLRTALVGDHVVANAWRDITPIARNEFICWVVNAKLIETRKRRIRITLSKLSQGERRPCCWPGCMHRERNGK